MISNGPTCRKCGDWLETHDGKPACKSGCAQSTYEVPEGWADDIWTQLAIDAAAKGATESGDHKEHEGCE
jgi:hypothetical protein